MVIQRGEIWWADLPDPPGSKTGYRRPVLIVQDNFINQKRLNTTIVIPLSSNVRLSTASTNVLLPSAVTGLPKDSVAITTLIETAERALLTERVGSLSHEYMEEVDYALMCTLGLMD